QVGKIPFRRGKHQVALADRIDGVATCEAARINPHFVNVPWQALKGFLNFEADDRGLNKSTGAIVIGVCDLSHKNDVRSAYVRARGIEVALTRHRWLCESCQRSKDQKGTLSANGPWARWSNLRPVGGYWAHGFKRACVTARRLR